MPKELVLRQPAGKCMMTREALAEEPSNAICSRAKKGRGWSVRTVNALCTLGRIEDFSRMAWPPMVACREGLTGLEQRKKWGHWIDVLGDCGLVLSVKPVPGQKHIFVCSLPRALPKSRESEEPKQEKKKKTKKEKPNPQSRRWPVQSRSSAQPHQRPSTRRTRV